MTAMQPQLESLIHALATNDVAEDFNLGGTFEVELMREAAQFLQNYLSEPPVRRDVRRSIKVKLNVAKGFGQVVSYATIGQNLSGGQTLIWEVDDISLSGFSTRLPLQESEGLHIGSLLGMQPDGVPYWGVAVVRRLMRDSANLLQVGVEILANRMDGVVLSRSGENRGALEGEQSALWLYAKQGEPAGEVCLLMKAGTYSGRCGLHTQLEGKNYSLMPEILQEKGLDYDLAKFRIIE
jgi:hypothetical protein